MYSRHIREGFGRDTAPVSIDQRAQIIPYVRAVVGDPRQFRIPHGEGFMAGSICHFPGTTPESSVFCQIFPIAVEHSKVVKLEQHCIRDDLDPRKDRPGGKPPVIRDHAQTGIGISVLIADVDRCGVTWMTVDIFSDPECLVIDLTLFTDDRRPGRDVSAGRDHTVCRACVGPVKFPGCHPDLFQFKNLRGRTCSRIVCCIVCSFIVCCRIRSCPADTARFLRLCRLTAACPRPGAVPGAGTGRVFAGSLFFRLSIPLRTAGILRSTFCSFCTLFDCSSFLCTAFALSAVFRFTGSLPCAAAFLFRFLRISSCLICLRCGSVLCAALILFTVITASIRTASVIPVSVVPVSRRSVCLCRSSIPGRFVGSIVILPA